MKRKTISLMLAVALALVAGSVVLVSLAHAQTGGGYDLTWSSIDGGGYMFSTGGGYSLGGTIGQADAGVLNGGGYSLMGGFWGGTVPPYSIYLPLILRG